MKSLLRLFAMTAVFAPATYMGASEGAVLRSGFTISHDHHEQRGAITRLFLSATEREYVDVATNSIASFETEGLPAAPLPQPEFIGPSSPDLDKIVQQAARENQLDPDFIHAVIRAESKGNPRAVSRQGAQGLMQLMPHTAAGLGVKNVFDLNENVSAGTRYLRALLVQYNNDPVRALAAYNAGPARVQQYHGVPPYRETRAYIAGIIREFNRRKLAQDTTPKKSVRFSQVKRPTDSD